MTRPSPSPVAFVTGASRGIGAAIAIALARQGFTLVLAARDVDACGDTRSALGDADATVVPCDIADPSSIAGAIEVAIDRHGRLDALVNNAGRIDPIARITDVDVEAWSESLRVNLVGHLAMTRAALPHLLRSASPTIVNLSSGAAHAPREGWSAYCSAKAALAMLTRCIALEHPGMAVYGLQPGVVDTPMQGRIRGSGINPISRIPREQLAPPSHPARYVAWLCRERPADLIGQDLNVADQSLGARADGLTDEMRRSTAPH